jgi:hypothetical protein
MPAINVVPYRSELAMSVIYFGYFFAALIIQFQR